MNRNAQARAIARRARRRTAGASSRSQVRRPPPRRPASRTRTPQWNPLWFSCYTSARAWSFFAAWRTAAERSGAAGARGRSDRSPSQSKCPCTGPWRPRNAAGEGADWVSRRHCQGVYPRRWRRRRSGRRGRRCRRAWVRGRTCAPPPPRPCRCPTAGRRPGGTPLTTCRWSRSKGARDRTGRGSGRRRTRCTLRASCSRGSRARRAGCSRCRRLS
mmetsp:Transcript_61598/g.148357  ORF Transcript_61598/g.148357 Transcript_61598/m.148357 type:complete len:216 (+) Transcript_61598:625-1272(+)